MFDLKLIKIILLTSVEHASGLQKQREFSKGDTIIKALKTIGLHLNIFPALKIASFIKMLQMNFVVS